MKCIFNGKALDRKMLGLVTQQIWKIMKLMMFLLTVLALQVSAKSFSQTITFHSKEKITVEKALNIITKQAGYSFIGEKDILNKAPTITLSLKKATLTDALNQCLKGLPLTYDIEGKIVVLVGRVVPTERVTALANESTVEKPDTVIHGRVTDNAGKPLVGVTIQVKGTTTGTTTDVSGKFSLSVSTNAVLIVSSLGYTGKEVPVNGRNVINVVLVPTTTGLNQLVVVGYGVQKKVDLTGAVEQISGKALENRPVANIGFALEGEIANLNISPGTDGGTPGSGVNYNIRGITSLSGGSPLFVVDGVPVDNINYIDPADIKSVTVLKDAGSSAIYGARAAYGVILITTKTGSNTHGKVKVSYGGMVGFNSPIRLPEQVNSLEFANDYNIASLNSGQNPMFGADQIARIKAFMADPKNTPPDIPDPNNPNYWSYATLDNDNVDWFKAYFKPTMPYEKHNLSISGGDDKTTYYVGAGYYSQGGFLRYGNEKMNRYNLLSNLHFTPLKWLKAGLNLRFNRTDLNVPSPTGDGTIGNWMHMATTRFPNWSLKDPNGHWAQTSNMEVMIGAGRGISLRNSVNLTGSIEIDPIKNWKVNIDYTYRNTSDNNSAQDKPYPYQYTVSGQPVMTTDNYFYTDMDQENYNSLNAYTSYTKDFNGGHHFSVLVGEQAESDNYSYLYGMARDLIATNLPSLGVAVGQQQTSGSLTHWSTLGTFARVNYDYKEKYLFEFNSRYDGSSKFQEGKRFGFFPSVSVGYNIAKENFWPLKNIFDLFKIRGSYGSLGNQDVPNYLYLSNLGIQSNFPYIINGVLPPAISAPGLVSPNLTWETASTTDIGLDVALLNERLTGTFDWYNRATKNMFGPANALPATLGATPPQENNADLRTRGFELTIGWKDNIGSDFHYGVSFNLSNSKSVVMQYNNPTKILTTYYTGETLGEIWGYTTVGIIQTQAQLDKMPDQSYIYGRWTIGDIEYKDLNHDGKIDIGDYTATNHGDLSVIGNSLPQFLYGLKLQASWKGLDMSLFLQGVAKQGFMPPDYGNAGVLFWGFTGGFGSNLFKSTTNFWTPENTNAYLPKPYTTGEVYKNQQPQTRYLQNAAYMRLKSFQLGYTLPSSLTQRIKLYRVRVFFSGENLLTFTHLPKAFDPELLNNGWGAGKVYPLPKTVSFGINIDL